MTEAFARNLKARLDRGDSGSRTASEAPRPPAELDAGSLVFSVIWDRIKAILRRLLRRVDP
jgi:hypothetical protein